MRRHVSGLLIALLAFGVSALPLLLLQKRTPRPVVPFSGVTGYSAPGRERLIGYWQIHTSPLRATEEFDSYLQRAALYMEFTPCFDGQGRRVGERAVMLMTPPHTPRPLWRIMWTRRSDNLSESFAVESVRLSEARDGEKIEQEGRKKCISTK